MTETCSIAAAIFDVDGTLLDTEGLNLRGWVRAAESLGHPELQEEHFHCTLGRGRAELIEELERLFEGKDLDTDELMKSRDRAVEAMIEEGGLPIKDGVDEILSHIEHKGIPMGVASSGPRWKVVPRLQSAGLLERMKIVVTGDDVRRAKPDPEVYLKAAAGLGVEPHRCLAIEDSALGVAAAHAAGMVVLQVPDILPPDSANRDKTTGIFSSLRDIVGWMEACLSS